MSRSPNDPPENDSPERQDDGNSGQGQGDGPAQGRQARPLKIVIAPSGQEVKFADFFGFSLSPGHGVIKFGVVQPETGEFIVHTQIAMTPQGMVALSNGLRKNIEEARKRGPSPGSKLN